MYTFTIENMDKNAILEAMIAAYNEHKGRFAIKLSEEETAFVRAFEYKPDHKDCEWFFVDGTEYPWVSDDSLEKLAGYFANYAKEKAELAEEKAKLRAYAEELKAIADKNSEEYREKFGYYSDWHKDLYGRRPRNII